MKPLEGIKTMKCKIVEKSKWLHFMSTVQPLIQKRKTGCFVLYK